MIHRTVSSDYAGPYDRLMGSGLYDCLVEQEDLVAHEEIAPETLGFDEPVHRILRPERIAFVSYPWEWSTSQLRDAALLTLRIARTALEHGMVLKDASAFNVQFVGCRPVFIDTLSFDEYAHGMPWEAYRQFCQHFLAPLELQCRLHPSMSRLLRANLDGVPLDVASRLLPFRSRLRAAPLLHIHAHGRAQRQYADSQRSAVSTRVSKQAFLGLLESLEAGVKRCEATSQKTEWGDYYDETNYTPRAMDAKTETVTGFVEEVRPDTVWDFGANTGRFSRICSDRGCYTVAFDIDPAAVDAAYREGRSRDEGRLLPLVMDLMDPTPSSGWHLAERDSILERDKPDLLLALALVHHLAIGQNVPLERVAALFAEVAPWLIIEFVPKTDSQVQRMLASRRDVFGDYSREGFEAAFSSCYDTRTWSGLPDSDRVLYLMERKPGTGE